MMRISLLCLSVLFCGFLLSSCQSRKTVSVRNANTSFTHKKTGIKIVSCVEVNDANPLSNLSLKLKDSGKQLVDIVILFSSNINCDPSTGEVIVTHNKNVSHLLENRDKYIKPLQDKGIQVVLSILGNHDHSGVANLSDTTAKTFAQHIKQVCDTYQLDGVFFDDEYSAYKTPAPAGFVTPSNKAAARLVYETKQAMPDKLNMVYVYSRTADFGVNHAISDADAGEYIDYALHDYGQSFDLTTRYPALPKGKWGMSSAEYVLGIIPSNSALETLRKDGYGAHMIFAFDPYHVKFNPTQKPALQDLARILFDEELVIDEQHVYKKDY